MTSDQKDVYAFLRKRGMVSTPEICKFFDYSLEKLRGIMAPLVRRGLAKRLRFGTGALRLDGYAYVARPTRKKGKTPLPGRGKTSPKWHTGISDSDMVVMVGRMLKSHGPYTAVAFIECSNRWRIGNGLEPRDPERVLGNVPKG